MESLLQVRGLVKRYGGVHALAGVDLDVRPGEVHAVVGENGVLHARWIKTKEQPVPPRTVMAVEFVTK